MRQSEMERRSKERWKGENKKGEKYIDKKRE
jgi:hypothetical protein